MDKEEIKKKCNLFNIQEINVSIFDDIIKSDYIIDSEGNAIIPVSILEFKMIEKIIELEGRIKELEKWD